MIARLVLLTLRLLKIGLTIDERFKCCRLWPLQLHIAFPKVGTTTLRDSGAREGPLEFVI